VTASALSGPLYQRKIGIADQVLKNRGDTRLCTIKPGVFRSPYFRDRHTKPTGQLALVLNHKSIFLKFLIALLGIDPGNSQQPGPKAVRCM